MILTFLAGNSNIYLLQIVAICNAGLVNGLTKETVLEHFLPFGEIENIILIPLKSCGFVIYRNIQNAEEAFNSINGKLNIAQNNKPLYLAFTEEGEN